MSMLDRIAFCQNRRDEVPNQALAHALAEAEDAAGIAEIAAGLAHPEPNVRSDCLKVLYEIGYLKPALVARYAIDFVKLLGSRNNRLVWGAMIGLSTVAEIAADELYPHVPMIQRALAAGSVITVDAGIATLAKLAATTAARRAALMPHLLEHLRTCRPKDVPQHAEKIVGAVTVVEADAFCAVVEKRLSFATPSQAARLRKVIKQAQSCLK